MKRKAILILWAVLLMTAPASAQKKKVTNKKKVATPVLTAEEMKFEEMLDATQQIMFIDSIVVDKQDFLDYYYLSADAGSVNKYNKHFNTEDQPYATVFVNQLGNKCWFSNDGVLYTIDKLNDLWSEPIPLEGLGRFQRTNYPFMLSDGLTLYFAAITDEGLGGLDIYMSRYDSEAGKFLLSENIGLPFNSDANDYMFALDEFNGIGYFASDRRQPEGKVCIYTFVPNQKRITYSVDEMEKEVIRSRAKIERIADTWSDDNLRAEALERVNDIKTGKQKRQKQPDFTFVINDDITYTQVKDFRRAENRERMAKLESMKKDYSNIGQEIEKIRVYYATKASPDEKKGLRTELLGYEQKYYQLEKDIRQLEKSIRSSELQAQ